MKRKSRILLLGIILIFGLVLLSGCVRIDETIHLEETTEAGRYYLYRTNDDNKYLKFLENFNEDKYEIYNISFGCGDDVQSEILYVVTYRLK